MTYPSEKDQGTDLENPLLNGFRHGKLANVHIALLTETMRAIERLVFQRWIPPQVDQDHVVATCQIETCKQSHKFCVPTWALIQSPVLPALNEIKITRILSFVLIFSRASSL